MVMSWDPRWAFKGGNIQIQTEYPYYEPGGTVNGKIFIQTMNPVPATHIQIEIDGKEKNKFYHYFDQSIQHPPPEGSPPGTIGAKEVISHKETNKQKNHFIDVKQGLYEIPGGCIAPGSFMLGFTFQLPDDLPSSLFFKEQSASHAKSKVKYTVTATIKGGEKKIKCK